MQFQVNNLKKLYCMNKMNNMDRMDGMDRLIV